MLEGQTRKRSSRKGPLGLGAGLLMVVAAGCGLGQSGHGTTVGESGSAAVSATTIGSTGGIPAPAPTVTAIRTSTTTTVPCLLGRGSGPTVPIDQVCSSAGAPHFDTPQSAMAYLAGAWNRDDVQEIDYVTNPAGRAEMDSMTAEMVNLQFKSCTPNPAGDYTCFFNHDIAPSTSPTTYPNPYGYPAGEAVFTVAPAATSGWYLTNVIHCG